MAVQSCGLGRRYHRPYRSRRQFQFPSPRDRQWLRPKEPLHPHRPKLGFCRKGQLQLPHPTYRQNWPNLPPMSSKCGQTFPRRSTTVRAQNTTARHKAVSTCRRLTLSQWVPASLTPNRVLDHCDSSPLDLPRRNSPSLCSELATYRCLAASVLVS
jgi:hypothetical protein